MNTEEKPEPGPQSVTGARINKGLVIVNTGNGKGKTTAAMGLMFRAWGRDFKVIMLQFIKHSTANFGEQRAAQKIGIEMRSMGDGFTWRSKDLDQSADMASAHWEDCKEIVATGGKPVGAFRNLLTIAPREGQSLADGGKLPAVPGCGGRCPVMFQYIPLPWAEQSW